MYDMDYDWPGVEEALKLFLSKIGQRISIYALDKALEDIKNNKFLEPCDMRVMEKLKKRISETKELDLDTFDKMDSEQGYHPGRHNYIFSQALFRASNTIRDENSKARILEKQILLEEIETLLELYPVYKYIVNKREKIEITQ